MLRRTRQALRHRRRPDGDDLDRRSGGRAARAARAALARRSSRRRLARLRGEIELPIPAASAVKIGGERAYRLARRGVVVEMPLRRSQVYALDVIAYSGDERSTARAARQLGHLRARDRGGPRRPLPDAAAHGGRAVPVEEADPERLLPAAEALARLPEDGSRAACRRVACGRGARASRRRTRSRCQRAREGRAAPRTSSSGARGRSRSAPSTASTSATGRSSREAVDAGPLPTVVTFDPHPREVLGYEVELLATLERRLELLAELGVEETLVVEFTPEVAALEPEEFVALLPARRSAPSSSSRARLPLRPRPARRPRRCSRRSGSRTRVVPLVAGRLVDRGSASSSPPATSRAAAPLLGRPVEVEGVVVSGDARGGTLGFPTANLRADRALLVPRSASTRGEAARRTAPRSRSASTRTTAGPSGGSRRSCSTSRATSTASGSSSSSGSGSATRRCSRARRSSSRRSRATCDATRAAEPRP